MVSKMEQKTDSWDELITFIKRRIREGHVLEEIEMDGDYDETTE